MTWVLVAWCALIIIWAVSVVATTNCIGTDSYTTACQAGTGAGVLVVLFIGFIGFVFFSIIWFMSKPKV